MNNVLEWILGSSSSSASSGAIDIVVVDNTFSPFHVKFTHSSASGGSKGEKKLVRVSVNGEETEVFMRLGAMGEAFFVERIREIRFEDVHSSSSVSKGETERETEIHTETERETAGCAITDKEGEDKTSKDTETNKNNDNNEIVETHSAAIITTEETMVSLNRDRRYSDGDINISASPRMSVDAVEALLGSESLSSGFRRERSKSDMAAFESHRLSLSSSHTQPPPSPAAQYTAPSHHTPRIMPLSPSLLIPAQSPSQSVSRPEWVWAWGALPVHVRAPYAPKHSSAAMNDNGPTAVNSAAAPAESKDTHRETERSRVGETEMRATDDGTALFSLNRESSEELLLAAPGKEEEKKFACQGEKVRERDYREAEDEREMQRESQRDPRACLSRCAHKLSLSPSLCADFPLTPQELLSFLFVHRVEAQEESHSEEDEEVVVLRDDFLLSLPVYRFLCKETSREAVLCEQDVHSAMAQCGGQRPPWEGRRLSKWRVHRERASPAAQSKFELCHTAESKTPEKETVRESEGERESLSQEESNHIAAEMETTNEHDSLSFSLSLLHSSAQKSGLALHALDFSTWKNAALGWRESFNDLLRRQERETEVERELERQMRTVCEENERERESEEWTHAVDIDVDLDVDVHPNENVRISLEKEEQRETEKEINSTLFLGEIGVKNKTEPDNITQAISPTPLEEPVTATNEDAPTTLPESAIGEAEDDTLSLHEVEDEEISPAPADGDFFDDSDTDSLFSFSLSHDEDTDREREHDSDRDDDEDNKKDKTTSSHCAHTQAEGDRSSSRLSRSRRRRYRFRKSLVPSLAQREKLRAALHTGRNEILFTLCAPPHKATTTSAQSPSFSLSAQLFVWSPLSRIVVVDLEAFAFKRVPLKTWFAPRERLELDEPAVRLLQQIAARGYSLLYFSSSSFSSAYFSSSSPNSISSSTTASSATTTSASSSSFASVTSPVTATLVSLFSPVIAPSVAADGGSNIATAASTTQTHTQLTHAREQLSLPAGPVFRSPEALLRAFGPARSEVFKAAALRGLRALFATGNTTSSHSSSVRERESERERESPLHAAFLGRSEDVIALERNRCPVARTFVITAERDLRVAHRTRTLSLADVRGMVDEIFPDISPSLSTHTPTHTPPQPSTTSSSSVSTPSVVSVKAKTTVQDEFCDFAYWRLPPRPLEDL